MHSVRFIFSILLIAFIKPGFSQPAGFKPVNDLTSFRIRFSEESAKVLSVVSDFKQEKELLALTEKITSTGNFWFKRSNMIRIDYVKPFVYRLIMNGDRILLKDEQNENKINVKSNKLFQQINRIMLDCIQGTILTSKDFSTRVYENDNAFLLDMTPVNKNLKEFFSTIRLFVDRDDYSVGQIEMVEPGGDRTVLTFSNKRINQIVSDEIFAL